MGRRRPPVATATAALLAIAVSLLGARLFVPGAALDCGPDGGSCCCPEEAAEPGAVGGEDGCGCSVSPATPLPAAVLAPMDGVALPALAAAAARSVDPAVPVVATREALPAPRARSAPTQALLETFRN